MAEKLLRRARATFPLVAVNAAPGGAVFWESLGFVADARDGHTHVLGHNDRSEPGRGRQMRAVYEDRYFRVVAPDFPLNSRADGGHLILFKKRPVGDRSELSGEEAIDFMRITMIVGRAMYDVLGVERMNYEDLGNWGIDEPGGAKMHLHFFGRAREQIHQIRGQHIFLYPKDHPIYKGHLERFDDEDLRRLETRIAELVAEPKYRKMAEQAGLTRNRAPSSP